MRLTLTVKPNARETKIIQISPTEYRVSLHAPPHDSEANAELIRVLAKHFHIPQSHLTIIRGITSRKKIVEIRLDN